MSNSVQLASGLYIPDSTTKRGQKALGGSAGSGFNAGQSSFGTYGGGWTKMGLVMGPSGTPFRENRLRDYESYLSSAIRIPWVYPAGTTIAWSYAASEWTVTTGRDGPMVDKGNKALCQLNDLLDRPNPFESGYDFREKLAWHLLLTGNAFMVMDNRDGNGRPTELYLMRPSKVRIKPDSRTYVKAFYYEVNGEVVKFDPVDVVWFKRPNSGDQYWGLGVIEPGEALFNKQRAIARTESQFFDSGARVKGILTYDGILTDEQENALRQQWRAMDEGQSGEYKTAILQAGMHYEPISSDLLSNGVGMETLAKMARDEILAMFGVPKQKVGIFEDANYRSIEADSFFQAETMRPLLRQSNYFWDKLIETFDPGWRFHYDEIVVTDYYDKAITAHYMSQSAAFKVNEIRKLSGHDPLPSDDPYGECKLGPQSMTIFDENGPKPTPEFPTTPGASTGAPSSTGVPGPTPDKPPAQPTSKPAVGAKSGCGCPRVITMTAKSQSAHDLGICSHHANAVTRVLDEGRRRSYSITQLTQGFPKEHFPGIAGVLEVAP